MKLKLNLLENSYDFINSSLYYYSLSTNNPNSWKIAFINMVQSIELMLKECLKRENNIFMYDNIDKPRHTVSLTIALDRVINILKLPLDPNDKLKIRSAIDIRTQMMHFEIEHSIPELKQNYSILFEFITSFHHRFLNNELHRHINEDLWGEEAELIEYFRNDLVLYNGLEVSKKAPKETMEAQDITHYLLNSQEFDRIRYGDERKYEHVYIRADRPCGDCNARVGQYHVPGCDWELCPRCYGQNISCGCNDEVEVVK